MNKPDPAGSTPEARERQAVAELLGRILARYWLRQAGSEPHPVATSGPGQQPLATAPVARPVE